LREPFFLKKLLEEFGHLVDLALLEKEGIVQTLIRAGKFGILFAGNSTMLAISWFC
jgi:hypothetical protein